MLLIFNAQINNFFQSFFLLFYLSVYFRLSCPRPSMPKVKSKFPLVRTKTIGSSHANYNHGVPHYLDKFLSGNKRFQQMEYNCEGGRTIDNALYESIIRDIDYSVTHEEPFVIVLVLGTNNIRKEGRAEDIFPFFEQLVLYCAKKPRVHIIICGLIPCPEWDYFSSKKNFSKASVMIENLCKNNENCASFVNVANLFTRDREILTEFYEDGTHLKFGEWILDECTGEWKWMEECEFNGAKVLAQAIFDKLRFLPRAKISHR